MNKLQGLEQRTRWLNPDALIDCQYGHVSILTWLTGEVQRIKKATGRAAEIREAELQGSIKVVALFAC